MYCREVVYNTSSAVSKIIDDMANYSDEINKNANLLRSTINIPNQMALLSSVDTNFKSIYPNLTLDDIFSNFKGMLNELVYVTSPELNDTEWHSNEHMNLKQLTGTVIPNSIDRRVPDMLKFQLAEIYHLNKLKYPFITCYNLFVNRLLNAKGCIVTVDSFRDTFKQLGIDVKRNMDNLTEDSLSLVDIDLVVGYNLRTPLTTDQKTEIATRWCKGYMPRGNDELRYYTMYSKCLSDRFKKISDFKTNLISLDEFILNVDLWMTDGSSRGIRLDLYDIEKQRYVKSKSKKQVIGLISNSGDIARWCRNFNPSSESYSVAEKIEPGRKKRCIISAHFVQQVRLAYVEHALGTLFSKLLPDVFYLQSQKQQNNIVNDLIRLSDNKSKQRLFLPLDASAFDQEVSKFEIELVFDAIIAFCASRYDLHKDVVNILEIAKHAWFNTVVIVDRVRNLGNWEHGVPSGVRWTALMDSIVNAIRFDVCKMSSINDTTFGPVICSYSMFQGDDMCLILHRPIDVLRIFSFYSSINVTIQPFKNFLAFHMSEFLRKVYLRGRQLAYVNRMVTKYLFRLPEKSGASTNSSLCRERTTTVFKMACRANNMSFFHSKVKHIFSTIFEITNESTILNILVSPSVLGGFGIILHDDKSVRAARQLHEITWLDNNFDEYKNIRAIDITGVYREQKIRLEQDTGTKIGDGFLNKSLRQALDPYARKTFSNSVRVKKQEFKFSPNMSLRFNFTNTGMGRYRPWMSRDNLKYPSLNDLIQVLRSQNNMQMLSNISAYEVLDVLNLLQMKADADVVWMWVAGTLPEPSILVQGLNDLSRAEVMKRIFYTYVTRFLYTHNRVTVLDFKHLCILASNYMNQNVNFAVMNKYVMYSTD